MYRRILSFLMNQSSCHRLFLSFVMALVIVGIVFGYTIPSARAAPNSAHSPRLSAASQASTADSGWRTAGADEFKLLSADKKAVAIGSVQWYHGKFPSGYLHRGEYSKSPVVFAEKSVECIWAQIKWGFPTSNVTFPPGASIQGAEEVGEFFVSCRSHGSRYPAVLSLGGLAYAKALLNSSTLTVCTSAKKSDGPRNCGTKKMYYG